MRTYLLASAIIVSFIVAACGGAASPSAPSAPGTPQGVGATSGATIRGTVYLGSASAPGAGLTVQVTGTALAATAGASGEFALAAVPAGPIELHFTGQGVDARASVAPVTAGDTVALAITITGPTAAIGAEDRTSISGQARVEGTIERLSGTPAAFSFFVGTREVRGNDQTRFVDDSAGAQSFASLRNGRRVEAAGTLTGAALVANTVHVSGASGNDDNPSPGSPTGNEVRLTGRIGGMSGAAPALTLAVGNRTVRTSAATVIRRGGNVLGFAALALQQMVEVEGTSRADASIDAAKITIEDDAAPEAEAEVEVKGTIAGLGTTGSCPSLRFSVANRTVVTNAATSFERVACNALRNGNRVEVKGKGEPNGQVTASRVRLE
jgi:hypothetical protein